MAERIRVLYVDDEPCLLDIARRFLERGGGFSVDTTSSVREALALMDTSTYDAIVSDYQMPGRDGIDFLKQVRSAGNPIPFILFTGKGREEIAIQALNEGADFYLQKGGEPTSQFAELMHELRLIVKRNQTEEALHKSHAIFDAALASMTDAVFISDTEGRFYEFNDAFATFHRFRNKKECDRTLAEYPEFLEVYLPDGTLAPLEMWAVSRALRGEIATNAEYTLRLKKTGETWIGSYNFSPIRDKNGTIIGSVVVGRDITQQKLAEKALRESEEKYKILSDNSDDLIYWIAPDNSLKYISPSCERLTGYAPAEFVKNPGLILEITHPDDRKELSQHFSDMHAAKQSDYREFRIRTKSGEERWISHSCIPIYTEDGQYAGRRASNRNITPRKLAEQQREVLIRELEEKNAELTRLTRRGSS
jgi:PAS domain S-box-containing protein